MASSASLDGHERDAIPLQLLQSSDQVQDDRQSHPTLDSSETSASTLNNPKEAKGDTAVFPLDKPSFSNSSKYIAALPPVVERAATEDRPDVETLETPPSGPPYSLFTKRQKGFIVFLTAWGGFFSPMSANIYFPALNPLAQDLKVSDQLINLTLTSYMVFQGLAPAVFGDLADMLGRRPIYILGFVVYIGANVGLALQDSYAALFVLRCLQSTGSSGTVAIGNGVVADIASSGERGTYMGYATFGLMAAPALAPVLGGILSQFLSWRAMFWFLAIFAVVYLIPFSITFPETGRKIVGNGSIQPPIWNMSLLSYLKSRQDDVGKGPDRIASREEKRAARAELARKRKLRWPNPMKTLKIVIEKDVSIILFYNSLLYVAFYDVTSSMPSLFVEIYGFNDLQIGLCYIPFGIGCSLATLLAGYLMDFSYRRVAKKANLKIDVKRGDDMRHFPIEKARIQVAWLMVYFGMVALLCYGWVLEQNAPLAAPLVLQFIIGISFMGSFSVLSTMLVDLYPMAPATATAANNLVRCFVGAAGTAVIVQMVDAMGRGWCFTFIAAVVFVTSPLLWVEMKWGPKWREERWVRVEKQRAAKEEARRVEAEKEKKVRGSEENKLQKARPKYGRSRTQDRVQRLFV